MNKERHELITEAHKLTAQQLLEQILTGSFMAGIHDVVLREKIGELQNTIIDMRACLRTCFNTSKGALEQYGK